MPASPDREIFLSTLPASRRDLWTAGIVVGLSAALFAFVVPFAGTPLTPFPAFVAVYQSALAVSDLITAILLMAQLAVQRSRGLLLLACGYLFTAGAAIVHALTFPGLFAPSGLLGAGPQTTVWLFMIWHAAFPLCVLAYAVSRPAHDDDRMRGIGSKPVLTGIAAVVVALALCSWIVTAQHQWLPVLLREGHYTPVMIGVVTAVWSLSLAALVALLLRRPWSLLDVWLMVVMCAWLFDIALSAVLNKARFDLGFYVGRIYGLCAASFVLAVLLVHTAALHARLAALLATVRREASGRERLFSAVVESSHDAIITKALDGTITGWNRAAEQLFGYTAAEAVGSHIGLIVPPDRLPEVDDILARIGRGDRIEHYETVRVNKEGREIQVSLSISPIRSPSGEIIGASKTARDLTDKLAAEAQIRQAQKMDAVGQLTGGIAHDFNNILTVITGTIGILGEAVADKPELASIARLIDEAADRGASLTKHLLAFARKQPLQPREIDINALVLETAKLLRPTLGEHVEVTPILEADTWTALVDPNQLSTSILNLALNARDAMPDGGKLALETRNVRLDEAYAEMHSEVTAGDYVMVAVSDTGCGIPAADLERVFEPFFTTKDVGKGTGLGLSMVFGFVKQSGGHIKVYSEQGHGTTVKIYLPRASGAGQAEAAAPVSEIAAGGRETILIVEDDSMVRRYVVTQITSLGYTTLEAGNATEALQQINANPSIDLLFTDVIMPGAMNGRQLANEAQRRRPALKVLYTSGYTENAIVHHGRLDPGVLLLAKPYRKAELARMIRTALAG